MKETELAAPIIDWLAEQHWDVYQEVEFRRAGGVADIVAVRDGVIWVIECKVTYGLAVLGQAAAWDVHYRSVAVPQSKSERRDYRVARDYYRVGVLEVYSGFNNAPLIREAIEAPLFLRKSSFEKRWLRTDLIRSYLSCLTPLHKTFAPAGSRNGYHLTPYRQTMIDVRKVIEAHPGCTVKFLYEQLGEMHYASRASFMGNLVKCLTAYEREWCRVETAARPYRLYVKA